MPKELETVKSLIENKFLIKLSVGKAFIKYLKETFQDVSVKIDPDEEYEKFLIKEPHWK